MAANPAAYSSQSFDWAALAAPGVQGLVPYTPGKPIGELARELGLTDIVKLASNENPLGASPHAIAAAQRALQECALYPDGGGFELKAALAARHRVDPDCITLGNGSNDVLNMVARAFLGPGGSAVYSEHAFAVYPIATQAAGAEGRVAPAHAYGHDPAAMLAAIDASTRVVFIANPNNPTGTWLSAAALRDFLTDLPRGVLAVVDEAYFEYVDEPDYPDCTRWLGEFPQLIVTRTFSKAFGLAGLRIGYALCAPAIAELLNRVRSPFNVNALAQQAAQAALDDATHLARSMAVNRDGLAELQAGCVKRGLSFIPSAGNFLCIHMNRPAGPVYERLLRAGVIVRPVANYGLPQHLRVTVGLPQQNARFLAALDVALEAELAGP